MGQRRSFGGHQLVLSHAKVRFYIEISAKKHGKFWEEKLLRGKWSSGVQAREAVSCKQVRQWGASKGSSELQARETQHFCLNLKDFCLNLKDFCSNLNFCSNLKDFGLKPKKKEVYKNRKSCGFHNSQTSFASRNLSSHNKTETSTQISLNLVNKKYNFLT